jgi:hypothetical protein
MLLFLADEDFDNRILRAFQRIEPALDWTRIQDLGLSGCGDDQVLEVAAAESRVVLSSDVSTMTAAAYRRLETDSLMAGLIVVPQSLAIGQAVDQLLFLARESAIDEWLGQVIYLPL